MFLIAVAVFIGCLAKAIGTFGGQPWADRIAWIAFAVAALLFVLSAR